jgi:[ribosomal protein S18]-alanine N-acetyltransferase
LQVQLRYFRSTDLSRVYDLACRSLKEQYNPSIFIELSPYWRQGFLVLEDMGEIIGFVFGIMVSSVEARILMLAINEQQRGRGLGALLCRQFFQECGNKGVKLVSLEVRASNLSAQRFYEKLGFVQAGIIEEYYSDKESGIALQLFL